MQSIKWPPPPLVNIRFGKFSGSNSKSIEFHRVLNFMVQVCQIWRGETTNVNSLVPAINDSPNGPTIINSPNACASPDALSSHCLMVRRLVCCLLPPFTHLGHVAEIFKPLGVSLGASLKSRLSPCSWLLHLGSTPNEAKAGRPY